MGIGATLHFLFQTMVMAPSNARDPSELQYTQRHLPAGNHYLLGQSGQKQNCTYQKARETQLSLDWFKGKSTGNHGFYHQIDRAFRLKLSHHPIL